MVRFLVKHLLEKLSIFLHYIIWCLDVIVKKHHPNWCNGIYTIKTACDAVISCLSVSSTSSSSSVLMLDEWGGCGFPPARPSWLTDLWMTLSPTLSLRSHTPQQCHICPAAQSATIWNGFVLRTPKWLQLNLLKVLCHSGCCRWWMPCHWQDCLRLT